MLSHQPIKKRTSASLRIETDRLLLIPFTREVTSALIRNELGILEREGLAAEQGWPDQDAIETFPKILRNLELAGGAPTGFESWLVLKKDSLRIIGDVGFKGRPNATGEADIGYAVIQQERRAGYGTEAASALVEWAFGQPGVQAITAKCLTGNTASARTLIRMGFREVSRDDEFISWRLVKNLGI